MPRLWLFEAARLYAEQAGVADPFLRERAFRRAGRALSKRPQKGTRHNIHITEDGLFAAADPGFALTWMDAKVGDWVVTPRAGLPGRAAGACGREPATRSHRSQRPWAERELAARAAALMRVRFSHSAARFWCENTGYPYDVVSEPAGDAAWARLGDSPERGHRARGRAAALRCAASGVDLAVAERDLLTPAGLRTLAPQCDRLPRHYAGGVKDRDSAYHEGTVWPFLLGFLRAGGDPPSAPR